MVSLLSQPVRTQFELIFSRETGSKITLEQKKQSLAEMQAYRNWFAENVLATDTGTGSDAIMLMPLSCYAPDYRDTIHK